MQYFFGEKNESQKGFTMIELIITVALLAFGVIALYSAFSQINALNYSNALNLRASYLAQEGLEITRNLRDTNLVKSLGWNNGLTGCSSGCQADYKTISTGQLAAYNSSNFLKLDADGFYSYAAGTDSPFTRKITIVQSGEILQVTILVSWSYNSKSYSFTTSENIYNWY